MKCQRTYSALCGSWVRYGAIVARRHVAAGKGCDNAADVMHRADSEKTRTQPFERLPGARTPVVTGG